jgi:hypothetical protein
MIFQSAVQCIPRIRLQVPGSGTLLAPSSPCPHLPASPVLLQSSIRDSLSSNLLDLKPLALFHMLLCLTVNVFKTVHSHVDMLLAVSFFVRIARSSAERYQLSDVMLRICLSCMLLFVEWPQAVSPLSRTLQPAPYDSLVRSAFVSHNNKGRQRVYIDSHYLDNIIINAHLHSHSEHVIHNHTYMYAAAPRLCDVMWREFTLPSSRRLNVEKVQVNWKPL